jgi:hypothetical protein
MPSLGRFFGGTDRDEDQSPDLQKSLASGAWTPVPGFCQLVLLGTGNWTYDTKTDAGVIATGVGSGSGADVVPIYMGGATQIRVNFPSTLTVKVN